MDNTVKKLNTKTYEISYIIQGKIYKMVVTPIRGPTPVLQIRDETDEDITDKVLPYLGPRHDWHGSKFTADIFGCKKMTFELADGTDKLFETNNVLKL